MAVFDPRFELYAITDQASAKGRSDLEVAQALITGGATCLQYRAKKTDALEQWKTAHALRELTRQKGVFFIVNDRLDLAMDAGADAVHLGQDDMPLAAVRRLAGRRLLLGRSTHSYEQARQAIDEGADYIACGPIYTTQTKENNVPPVGIGLLSAVLKDSSLPVVAIGGIKRRHLPELAASGTRHIAVVTALTSADDIAAETAAFLAEWRVQRSKVTA